jgi:hypothetical protein
MEDLYMWKDMLMVLFNLIDYNHSGRIDFILMIIYRKIYNRFYKS